MASSCTRTLMLRVRQYHNDCGCSTFIFFTFSVFCLDFLCVFSIFQFFFSFPFIFNPLIWLGIGLSRPEQQLRNSAVDFQPGNFQLGNSTQQFPAWHYIRYRFLFFRLFPFSSLFLTVLFSAFIMEIGAYPIPEMAGKRNSLTNNLVKNYRNIFFGKSQIFRKQPSTLDFAAPTFLHTFWSFPLPNIRC